MLGRGQGVRPTAKGDSREWFFGAILGPVLLSLNPKLP